MTKSITLNEEDWKRYRKICINKSCNSVTLAKNLLDLFENPHIETLIRYELHRQDEHGRGDSMIPYEELEKTLKFLEAKK